MSEWGQNPTARTVRSLKNDPLDADPVWESGRRSGPPLPFHVHAKSPLFTDLQAPASR